MNKTQQGNARAKLARSRNLIDIAFMQISSDENADLVLQSLLALVWEICRDVNPDIIIRAGSAITPPERTPVQISDSRTVKRIDPIGCGCTDCIVGYSIPLDIASEHQIKAMVRGHLIDATAQTERDRLQ